MYIKYSKEKEKLVDLIQTDDGFQNMKTETVVMLNTLTNSKLKFNEEKEETSMCLAIDELREEAKQEGIEFGRRELIEKMLMNHETMDKIKEYTGYTQENDALYGRSDVENKNGSLNNTIFRLRKQLTAAGLPESSYININGGMCTWDPDIETSVDVCDFKQTIESARHEKSQKTKMEIYAKAWKLYTGEFLPDMMGEDWAAVENIACRDMYFDCVEELCHYLKTEEKFEELYRVAHSAAEIYPFYDWQIWEIDSLIGMSRYKDGLDVYKRTTKLMFDELGLSPSAGMLERFKLMGERTSQAAGAIEDIKYRLREKESIEGAYYCTYPSFVDVYHVFGRMMERTGMSVFLMLCTLNFINIETDDENQKYYSELLRESIQKAVRKGDFYTRYNIQQYLVMLIGITQENCTLVSKRINKEFNKRLTRRKNVSIDYYVASLGEVCND